MDTIRHDSQSGPAHPADGVSGTASLTDGGCKIIPFRQKHHRESSSADELVQGRVVAGPANEESLQGRRSFPAVCVPQYSEEPSPYGYTCEEGDPAGSSSPSAPRWLKRLLLVGTFTAFTAAAVALTVALG
jgi:hypothetical protein